MPKLVLIRHGESTYNKQNRFTGWLDAPLSREGIREAERAAELLSREKFNFRIAFTSVLKRAVNTLKIIQKHNNLKLKVVKCWRLNERHYGALQGLNKSEMAARYGERQVLLWRRAYNVRPPLLPKSSRMNPARDPKYSDVPKRELPLGESLADTVKRVRKCWNHSIKPELKKGDVLIVAHGNSIRAIIKIIEGISGRALMKVNIPTGFPLVYELDEKLKPKKHYYLGPSAEIKKAIEKVENQGRTK
ncbi:MAG: 2,3-diphosphoglycerate-dependent phosphoglycerate mutase [Candidatus Woesearchaeota archaeon]